MFNFIFRKNENFDKKRPNSYKNVVSKKEYAKILDFSIEHCKRFGEITSIKEGTIKIYNQKEGNKLTFHLDNLVRKCKYYKVKEWEEVVDNHFARYPVNENKIKFLSKDFEYARPMIKLLVRTFKGMDSDYICRQDIPNTSSFLILDYDEIFHFLQKEDTLGWNVRENELFEIALANIAIEDIDIKEVLWKNQFELHTFKKTRKERNITQEELGKLIGVQKAQISRLEKGSKNVSIATILKVFDALKAQIKFKIELQDAEFIL